MTQEEAKRIYRRKVSFVPAERNNWFNDPSNWADSDRQLSPAEFEYAIKALCLGASYDEERAA